MDQVKELLRIGRRYALLQLDCLKLSASEKATMLIAGLAMGLIGILLGALCIVLLAMSAVSLFGEIMSPALAYLCVAGCIIIFGLVIFILRKQLIINPIARLITKLICPKEPVGKEACNKTPAVSNSTNTPHQT